MAHVLTEPVTSKMIQGGLSTDKLLTDAWELVATGTTTDSGTPSLAWPMVYAAALFLPVAIPEVLGAQHMSPAWAVGAAICLLATAAYLAYSALAPEIQRRMEQSRMDRYFRYNMVRSFAYYSNRYGGILNEDGSLNLTAIHRIFVRFDRDKNGRISREELAGGSWLSSWSNHWKPIGIVQ